MITTRVPISGWELLLMPLLLQLEIGYVTHGGVVTSNMHYKQIKATESDNVAP